MSSSPDGIYERGVIDPGLPVKEYSQPFWLSEPSSISKLQSLWLQEADIVIIGSGMTSVSLCRTLYSICPELKIVVLEARELCSGATGRNGGHCKAMSPGVWYDYKSQYGVEEAVRIMQYEHSHLQAVAACAEENKIDCDLRIVEGLDVYHDESVLKRALDALEDMRQYSPELAAKYMCYLSRADLQARHLGEHCLGAIGMAAGTLWPYKFVTGLFEKMVSESDLSIQTNSPVTSISDKDGDGFAIVRTSRGDVRGRQVVHATNSWIGHLLHELRPFISPVRANVQRQVPRPSMITVDDRAFWLRYGEKDYDYMIQRPDGSFIMGRANTGRRATADDSKLDLVPHAHLRAVTPQFFDFGTKDLEVSHAWSGAVAFTEDHNPLVGQITLPGRRHQWVCGAYQGIGMVKAFRTAQVLAMLLLGKDVPAEYPQTMLLTPKRLRNMQRSIGSKL
ncbi:hypothetical protein Daus18300_013743 [Diaporthe australafricana]|uniref:FAD dependent oxidoreductase domain-containing protein n=1 Tax=Diaporthe australafricana TaxID=127596 RepID=A0ABR3VXU2_9PEZI